MNERSKMYPISELDIAVIGMAGRFPGCPDIDSLWKSICNGKECISFYSKEELLEQGVVSEVVDNPNYVKAGAFLDGVEMFDAEFFGINPLDARIMDPQQRHFLECSWSVLENAGYVPSSYDGRIGVFAGSGFNSYIISALLNSPELLEKTSTRELMYGNGIDFLTTRSAYYLNLKGPCVGTQTACSTSLVAIHLACQSLINGESDMALAGGVSFSNYQKSGYLYQEGGILSPDGHCRPFDIHAKGTVATSGIGIVALKRLADAVADGDTIDAVIKGSAINNDGSEKVGFTAPSVIGQVKVIQDALDFSDIDPETVGYIEAHGTGTELGDPIEVSALNEAYSTSSNRRNSCAIGSVKSNLGHLDAAAGVTGFIKAVLCLKEGLLPPSLHFTEPNPKIDFSSGPFYVNTELRKWETKNSIRRAAVSSLGIGGTNAHVILEEWSREEKAKDESRHYELIPISAKTESALDKASGNLERFLEEQSDCSIGNLAFTMQVGRTSLPYRKYLIADSSASRELRKDHKGSKLIISKSNPSICKNSSLVSFLFPGGGSQHIGMARELYQNELVFRETVDQCCNILDEHIDIDIRDFIDVSRQCEDIGNETLGRLEDSLNQIRYIQPTLFVIDYALAKMWIKWGVNPAGMLGHSTGEYVAACIAGVFSLEEALRLVALRGRFMQNTDEGRMIAVNATEIQVREKLQESLCMAAVNGSSSCVVSGPIDELKCFEKMMTENGFECRYVSLSHAFHSPMMISAADEFYKILKLVKFNKPKIPFVSNISGKWITDRDAVDPEYWRLHMMATVRFGDGLDFLLNQGQNVFLEVGPGQSLRSLTQRHFGKRDNVSCFASLPHPEENSKRSDSQFHVMITLGLLWMTGVRIDWNSYQRDKRRKRIHLPTYPFEGKLFSLRKNEKNAVPVKKRLDRNSTRNLNEFFYVPSWKRLPVDTRNLDSKKKKWLLFLDGGGFDEILCRELTKQGHDFDSVFMGESYSRSSNSFILNPDNESDFELLFLDLKKDEILPSRIVYLWGTGNVPHKDSGGSEDLEEFYRMLFLFKTLDQLNALNTLMFFYVSSGLLSVYGNETIHPYRSMLLGLLNVVRFEYPGFSSTSIDLQSMNALDYKDDIVGPLLTEILGENSNDVIAYRNGTRWLQTYEAFNIGDIANEKIRLRKKGVYIITGGLGKIGWTLAHYLVREYQVDLVLLGRSVFPGEEMWEDWLENHDSRDPVSMKIKRLKEWKKVGSKVFLHSVDVTNESEMRELLNETEKQCGHINGVFHLAGNTHDFSLISELDVADCEAQFNPKIRGVNVLGEILSDKNLDFCLLFSSMASMAGRLTAGAYATANRYMDSYAELQSLSSSFPWICVNWGFGHFWDSDYEKFETNSSDSTDLLEGEGEELIRRILGCSERQVIVSSDHPYSHLDSMMSELRSDPLESEEMIDSFSRSNLSTEYVAPRNSTEEKILEIWQSALGMKEIGVEDNFLELGGNSLIGIQMISKVKSSFKVNVPFRELYTNPTIAAMSEHIDLLSRVLQVENPVDFKNADEIEEGVV